MDIEFAPYVGTPGFLVLAGLGVCGLMLTFAASVVSVSRRVWPESAMGNRAHIGHATPSAVLDRTGIHTLEAIVAAAGADRHVLARVPLNTCLEITDPVPRKALMQVEADFLVIGADGRPLLAVFTPWSAPGEAIALARTALETAHIPVVTLDEQQTLHRIGKAIREALGDCSGFAFEARPALLGARLGSTWG